jgi:hypothetical protein
MGGLYETGRPVCTIQRVRKHRVDYLSEEFSGMPNFLLRRRGNTLAGHLGLERHAGKLARGVPQSRGVSTPP